MATINVKDAAGSTVALEKPLAPGRAAAAASRPVALSTEDAAFLDGIETLLAAATPAGTNLIGKVGIDQTTDGTTNKVAADLRVGGAAVDKGAGTGGTATPRVIIDSSQFSALGQTTKSASAPVTVASDQGYAGNTGGITAVFSVTLSLDTSVYAAGDVLADTQVLTSLFRIVDGTGWLNSIQVIDQDDQKAAMDFYFLLANVSMGTENAAPSITDANAVNVIYLGSVAVADYKDLGGASVAKLSNIGQAIKATSTTTNGYITVVNGAGTPTFTASGIKLLIGVGLD